MKIGFKNAAFIGVMTLWGAGAGTSTYKLVKGMGQGVKRGTIERVVFNQKIDSLQSVLRQEFPANAEKAIKGINNQLMHKYPSQKIIGWQHALDSMRVAKIGNEALQEFNSASAIKEYSKMVH